MTRLLDKYKNTGDWDMHSADARKSFEKRKTLRQKYSGHILFVTKEGFCEKKLENFSDNDLFIKTRNPVPVGEIATFAIPYSKNINYKRKGVVVWRNENGFGVNFLEERNYELSNLIPLKFS
jgi:hypothetical protein